MEDMTLKSPEARLLLDWKCFIPKARHSCFVPEAWLDSLDFLDEVLCSRRTA